MALNLPLGSNAGGAHTQASLPSLPAHYQSDAQLTAHLASRFHASIPTARLSSHAIICTNTYTTSTKGDGVSAQAAAEDMADRALLRLGHRSENQAILFLYDRPPRCLKEAGLTYICLAVVNPAQGRRRCALTS